MHPTVWFLAYVKGTKVVLLSCSFNFGVTMAFRSTRLCYSLAVALLFWCQLYAVHAQGEVMSCLQKWILANFLVHLYISVALIATSIYTYTPAHGDWMGIKPTNCSEPVCSVRIVPVGLYIMT